MALVRQQHEIKSDVYEEFDFSRQWARLVNSRLGSANQVQQVIHPNINGCAQAWSDIFTMDIRFVGNLAVDHLRQRAIIVMQSASSEPSCVIPGATVHELSNVFSTTPANFGGDGNGWWKVCYVVPDASDSVDLSAVSGSLRFATWFTCEGDLPEGVGNYGDGVAILFNDDSEYVATFGTAHAETSVSTAALPLDALFLWVTYNFRSIDDITETKLFHNEDSSFNDDYTAHNVDISPAEPGGGVLSSIDWTTDNRNPQASAQTYTMGTQLDAVASAFPGACRVMTYAFGADLRAQCS